MSDEVKPTKPTESTDGKSETSSINEKKKTDTQVQAIQGGKRMPQHSEVVKNAELDQYADPNDPKDPKDREAYDHVQMQKQQIEQDQARELRKQTMQKTIQGDLDNI